MSDKIPSADITVKIIRELCTFRKMDEIDMLMLASKDLWIMTKTKNSQPVL